MTHICAYTRPSLPCTCMDEVGGGPLLRRWCISIRGMTRHSALTQSALGAPGTTSSSTISDELRRAAFHINPKDIIIEQGEHGPVQLGKGAFGEARPCFIP